MSNPNVPAGYLLEGGLRVKYELAWDRDEQTATIIRSVYAGVSGPHGEATGIDSREAAEAFAFGAGKIPAGAWESHPNGDCVPLTSFK